MRAATTDPPAATVTTSGRREEEPSHAGTLRQTGSAMQTIELTIDASRQRIIDLTDELERFCAELGDGLVNVFVPHATAGVALMETGSGSDGDLLAALERLLPRDDRYRHAHGSPGHGADHLLPALVSPSVTLPVLGGSGRARDLAVGGAGGSERRQPPPARALQLRAGPGD